MLQIVDSLPGMNVCSTRIYPGDSRLTVEFGPSPHGGLERLWFHFRLDHPGTGPLPPKTRLLLKNINTMLCSYEGNFRPVIRYSGGGWQRLPVAEKLLREDGCLSLAWEVDTPVDTLEVAFCYPYGQPELDRLLVDTNGYWRADEIGVSSAGRPFYRLSNHYGSTENKPGGFYAIARQHAQETSGAWVLDGLLRRLAELKSPIPVWVIPFANLDGVVEGDYGKDPFPHDLNRAWGPHAVMRHEVKTMEQDLRRWAERVADDSLVMDFHSPGADESEVYVFANPEMPAEWPVHARLEHLKSALGECAAPNFIRHSGYKPFSAWGNFWNLSEFAFNKLKHPHFSMETSYYEAGGKLLEIRDYQEIGRRIADWCAKYRN